MSKLTCNPNKTGKHITYVMSDLQKLAQKENFALFTLVGIRSNTYHLKDVCKREEVDALRAIVIKLEMGIRYTQLQRKQLHKQQKVSKAK